MKAFCVLSTLILINYFSSAQLDSTHLGIVSGIVDTTFVNLDSLAKSDAKVYYKHYRDPAKGSFIFGLFAVPGIVPATIMFTAKPKEKNLGYPSQELWSNTQYAQSYLMEAKKIKRKKVAKNFAFGLVLTMGFFTLFENSLL